MNFNVTSTPKANKCHTPTFTATLRGPVVRKAIQNIKDAGEIGELYEVFDRVRGFGDSATVIHCAEDGMVKVSNKKFGDKPVAMKFHMNDKSKNKYLEFLKQFGFENSIIRCEAEMFNDILAHTRNKKGLCELYANQANNSATRMALQSAINMQGDVDWKVEKSKLQGMKDLLLNNFASYF